MKIYSPALFIILFLFAAEAYGQVWRADREHFVFGLGANGFMGDLGGADDIGSQSPRDFDFRAVLPSVMIGYRNYLFEKAAIRGNIVYAQVSGHDKYTDQIHRNNRNIHFRSPLFEVSFQGEYYFYDNARGGARYRRTTRTIGWIGYDLTAYFFAGIGGFYYNPKAKFEKDKYMELEHATVRYNQLPDDGWYDLAPIRTEGQGILPTRDEYGQFRITVPFGIGGIMRINQDLLIGMEYGFRKTWTDGIDDVELTYVSNSYHREKWKYEPDKIALAEYFSNPTNYSLGPNTTAPGQQRGGPRFNDCYMFLFITAYYRIELGSQGIPRF